MVARVRGDERPLADLPLLDRRLVERPGAHARSVFGLSRQVDELLAGERQVVQGVERVFDGDRQRAGAGEPPLGHQTGTGENQPGEVSAADPLGDPLPGQPLVPRPQRGDGVGDQREGAAHIGGRPEGLRREGKIGGPARRELLVAEVSQRQKNPTAHVGPELLVPVPVGYLLPGEHLVAVGLDEIDRFAEAFRQGVKMQPPVTGLLRQQGDLFGSRFLGRPDRDLPGRTVETPHIGVHKGDPEPASGNPDRHGAVFIEGPVVLGDSVQKLLKLTADRGGLAGGTAGAKHLGGVHQLPPGVMAVLQRLLEPGNIVRAGDVGAQYLKCRVTVAQRDRTDDSPPLGEVFDNIC